MIWSANSFDGKQFSVCKILLSCLKFWDSTLLIRAYFGSTNKEQIKLRIDQKRNEQKLRENT